MIRFANEAEKSGKKVASQYSGELGKMFEVDRQMRREIKALDDAKVKIKREVDDLETRMHELTRPQDITLLSAERLQSIIQEKEQRLNIAGNLNKQDEAKLNKEINDLKRALPKAKSHIEVEA